MTRCLSFTTGRVDLPTGCEMQASRARGPTMSVETYTGSCHCGAIRFEADIDLDEGSNRCNCSYCAKARTWFAFAKGPQRFRLLDGTGVSEYRWTPPGELEPHMTFTFCRTCGIR